MIPSKKITTKLRIMEAILAIMWIHVWTWNVEKEDKTTREENNEWEIMTMSPELVSRMLMLHILCQSVAKELMKRAC